MRFMWFRGLSRTARAMCAAEGLLFVVLLAAGPAVYFFIYPFERPLPYAIGLFTGCLVSFLKIIMLEKTLSRSVDMGKNAKVYASLHAMLRFFLAAAAVAPAFIFRGSFGVFGVVAGLLTLQLSAFIASVAISKDKRKTAGGIAGDAQMALAPDAEYEHAQDAENGHAPDVENEHAQDAKNGHAHTEQQQE